MLSGKLKLEVGSWSPIISLIVVADSRYRPSLQTVVTDSRYRQSLQTVVTDSRCGQSLQMSGLHIALRANVSTHLSVHFAGAGIRTRVTPHA